MEQNLKRYFKRFPLVIAHRGASKRATENSAQAITTAIECGADMIEVDLRTTKEGVFVLFHDEDTSRLTGEKHIIEDSTLEELKGLHLKGGGSILTLEESFEIVSGKTPLNLELKSVGSGKKLATLLEKISYNGFILVSSFLLSELDEFKELLPHIPSAALVRNPTPEDIFDSAQKGHVSIHVNRRYLKKWMAHDAATLGIALLVYTVDDRSTFERLTATGAAGVFTNVPENMVRWRDNL